MDLPKTRAVVDRLFERFALRWAKSFLKDYEGLDIELVKQEWIDDLSKFTLPQVSHAFEALKDQTFPPSLPTFCAYCKAAPPPVTAKLPEKFTPEQLQENRERVAGLFEVLARAKRMPVS